VPISINQSDILFCRNDPGFFFKHDRNIIPDRISQAICLSDQFIVFLLINQRSLADRAGEYIQ
jgi:hypothetical protein